MVTMYAEKEILKRLEEYLSVIYSQTTNYFHLKMVTWILWSKLGEFSLPVKTYFHQKQKAGEFSVMWNFWLGTILLNVNL